MTVIEQRTYEAICSLATALEQEVPKITGQLNCIVGALEVIGSTPQDYHPKEDPKYCMDFDEWAARLDFSDRRRLMNFLWNDEGWHATCLREEDAPWEDASKLEPPDISESAMGPGDDEDLPF